VRIETVRHPIVTLHVFDDAQQPDKNIPIASIELHRLKHATLHAVMQKYFEPKSESELQAVVDARELHRRERSMIFFRTDEYQRKAELYGELFRRDVMQQTEPVTWFARDWLWNNYDDINFRRAVLKHELVEYAQRYLKRHAAKTS